MPPARDIQDKPAKIPYLTKPLHIPDIPMYYSVISSNIIPNNPDLLDKPVYKSLALLRRAREYENWLVSQAGIITL